MPFKDLTNCLAAPEREQCITCAEILVDVAGVVPEVADQRATESQRRQAVQSLVGSNPMLLIAAPVYLYHWRRVQAEASAARAVRPVDAATAPPD